jgi:hypothetical protein
VTAPVVAAAVCPQAPFLVAGATGRVDPGPEVRSAARSVASWAVARTADAPGRGLVVVGRGPTTGDLPVDARFTADRIRGTPEAGSVELPVSLGLGRQLVEEAGGTVSRLVSICEGASPSEAAHVGRTLPRDTPAVLLVMADGSACRGPKAPGYVDPRAEAFDHALETALATGEVSALAGLDPTLCDELLCQGREALQVLAGAVDGADVEATLAYHDASFGVAYMTATWNVAHPRDPARVR